MSLIGAALLLVAIWIAVPAPNLWVLPLGVGAPEVSPVLLTAAAITLLLSLRGQGVKKLGVLFALAAAGLSAIPLSRLSATTRAFDRELAGAFPAAASTASAGMRPSPVVFRDLFLGLGPRQPRISRGIQFAAPEGLPLVLDIYRPEQAVVESDAGFPILVQIHGGAWQRGSRTDDETMAWYFANQGYVVIAIEYRLAPRWPWPAQLDDVRAALAWIRAAESTHGGNADRMVLAGRSAGAQLALVSAYAGERGVRAVVSYYGPPDLVEGWRDPPRPDPIAVRDVLEKFLGGTPETMPARYREASAVTYVSGNAPPTLQIQGARDHVVRPRFARDLHQRLKAAGARSVLLEIPWSEHAFDAVPQGLGGQLAVYYTERFLAAALAPRR